MTDLLPLARANVAARLRKDAEQRIATADAIEQGEQDDAWGIRHECARLEGEAGGQS